MRCDRECGGCARCVEATSDGCQMERRSAMAHGEIWSGVMSGENDECGECGESDGT
jgi:hypothetical protein